MLLFGVSAVRTVQSTGPRLEQMPFRMFALSHAPVSQEDEAARGAAFSFGLASHRCRELWPFAMGHAVPLQPPPHHQSMERRLSAKTALAHRQRRLLCNAAHTAQQSHTVPST